MPLTIDELNSFIEENDLANKVVCLHSSFKSLGGFEADVSDFCNAFLERGCTLMVPAHSWDFVNNAPLNKTPTIQSKWDYTKITEGGFTPDSTVVDSDKGIVTNCLINHPDRVRSNNPLGSFIAVGPHAEELLSHTTSYHSQFKTFTDLDGVILMLGLDCSKMTYIHYVKELCGEMAMVYRWVHGENGRDEWVLGGGCSTRFGSLAPVLEPVTIIKKLGSADVQVFNSKEILDILVPHFEENGNTTICDDPECTSCINFATEIEVIDENDYYQIKVEDTLWSLGEKFNVPWLHIQSLCEDQFFSHGQWLKLSDISNVKGFYQYEFGDTVEAVAEKFNIDTEFILHQCEGDTPYITQWINVTPEE